MEYASPNAQIRILTALLSLTLPGELIQRGGLIQRPRSSRRLWRIVPLLPWQLTAGAKRPLASNDRWPNPK